MLISTLFKTHKNIFSVNEMISGENETFKQVRISVNSDE